MIEKLLMDHTSIKKAHNAVIDCLTDDIFDDIREDYEDLDFDDVGFDDDMPFYD